MKSLFTTLLRAVVLAAGCSAGAHAQTYQQVWADEFTTGIGPSWVFETGGGGWGNNEKQYYQSANAAVVNGELQITARKQSVGGMPYTSARLKTQGLKQFTYGKVEARIKTPLGQGLWPAFWMLGANINTVSWPYCGEIDVMEQVNADSRCYGTVHWDSNGHAQYGGNVATAPNAYHVYSIEWTPSYIRWFVDGAKYHEINIANGTGGTEEFQKPFFLLLNLAVAGDWPGQTVDESKLPATMSVDYVRVYQLTGGTTPSSSVTLQAESANVNNGMTVEACSEGGQDMGYIDAGDYLVWNNVNFPTSGTYTIEYRVASGASGGTISSDLNAGSIQLGSSALPGTGGWQNWTTVSKTVNVNAGTYNFGVYAQTGGYNLNWVRITKQGSALMAQAAPETTAINAPKTTDASAPTLELYPNPVADKLYFRSEAALLDGEYRVMNAFGQMVATGATSSGALDVAGLPAGVYTLVLVSPGQPAITRRFVK
ncbi:carbohydrate-binding protein [Hymenobacter ruricola]|uniref:Family 16 glycosylhydrolase n=1 Tax=Hymenobacter ruricola TaxID=2791023 RepID=A0ABS0HY78_9BACT|nr:family 16 glycosylhydrolase [Hymenobacter ruricola]MBF9219653.1 family 16 glycosylhydrolase [Hymenobacter ruricola]